LGFYAQRLRLCASRKAVTLVAGRAGSDKGQIAAVLSFQKLKHFAIFQRIAP
jgi:hypothetical protein